MPFLFRRLYRQQRSSKRGSGYSSGCAIEMWARRPHPLCDEQSMVASLSIPHVPGDLEAQGLWLLIDRMLVLFYLSKHTSEDTTGTKVLQCIGLLPYSYNKSYFAMSWPLFFFFQASSNILTTEVILQWFGLCWFFFSGKIATCNYSIVRTFTVRMYTEVDNEI